ncbi:MAG: DUF89 family protein [Methanocorpusculum sp.]|nr:DUF89 family protein [Candidatus Methanocorpusculum equi]
MKLAPECRSCLLKKVRSQAKPAISGEKELDSLIAECECMFNEDFAKRAGAADAAGKIHRICYARMGISDPYLEIKDRDNRRAADTLSVVSEKISSLHNALTAAVIGNAMDYGITGHTVADDLPAFFNEMFSRGLTLDDSEEFLPLAPRVVYFTDNCGELIFDMQFIRELKKTGKLCHCSGKGWTDVKRCNHARGRTCRTFRGRGCRLFRRWGLASWNAPGLIPG